MATTELVKQSKTALAAALNRARAQASRLDSQKSSGQQTIARAFGSGLLGPSSALATGWVEGKFRNRDGSHLSLGPIPLSVLVAGLAQGAGIFFPQATGPLSYVTAANLGLAAGTLGREHGSKSQRRVKVGEDLDYGQYAETVAQADPYALDVGSEDYELDDDILEDDGLDSESGWTAEELELIAG